jgi:two-component system, sensor histidine kinase PdtaS
MATLAEIAAHYTDFDEATVNHLLRLTTSWSLLADLSFSDMLLATPLQENSDEFVILGQIRPNNRSTIIVDDLVGTVQEGDDWPLVKLAYTSGNRVIGETTIPGVKDTLPLWCIPVGVGGHIVAVLVRVQGPLRGPASLYEQAYLSIFDRLCTMVGAGAFPPREDDVAGPGLPRVGDGIILLDGEGRIEFATPNASGALHRLGVNAATEGKSLRELGLRTKSVDRALEYGLPSVEELEQGHDVAILFHCVPLVDLGVVTGVLVLLRDVSDVRQLNRIVLNREQAVREVHHRVKNNLQTISSLLRLQSRRTDNAETIQALREAERRVRSIAVVHEVLSREPGEDVAFDDIIGSIVRLVEDSVLVQNPVEIVVNGSLGTLATDVATPLAVALAELVTNAVEHAFIDFGSGDGSEVGIVSVNLGNDGHQCSIEIRDNGSGLHEGFSLETPTSLGLSIVRDLVRAQLHGTIDMATVDYAEGGGTLVTLRVPSRIS